MQNYQVTDAQGDLVRPGNTVTNFRKETGTFGSVTRGPEYNGTAKVTVDGREYYARIWGLTVKPVTVGKADKNVTPDLWY